MTEAHQPVASALSNKRVAERTRVDPQVQWVLDALSVPVAALDGAGRVITVNAVWREIAALSKRGTASCDPGDNYLQVCEAAIGRVAGVARLHRGLSRVLAGLQPSVEQVCRDTQDDAARDYRIHVKRIENQLPARFLVTHEDITLVVEAKEAVRKVGERINDAQTEERERLAEELHDSVGQNLVALGLGIARLRLAVSDDPGVASILADMAECLEDAHSEVRTVSYLLHPPWPEHHGALETAVREFAHGFGRRAGLKVDVRTSGAPFSLDRPRELTLFRILQEALVNIHRHACAEVVTIELASAGQEVTLEVSDDGKGIANPEGAAPPAGVGFLGMRARLDQFGGDLRIISASSGTVLRASLPTGSRARLRQA